MATIYQMKDGRVNVALTSHETTESVYWSPRWEVKEVGSRRMGGMNSYVLVEADPSQYQATFQHEGRKVNLVSINGIGEVRWQVFRWNLKYALDKIRNGETVSLTGEKGDAFEECGAALHFGLIEKPAAQVLPPWQGMLS